MKTKVGFVGLGLMGNPMSKNILCAGHEVIVWNRTAERMDDIVAVGAKAATSAGQVAAHSEVIITMLSDSPDVEEVILGSEGIIEGAGPGSVVIDMSTISPSVTRVIANRLAERNIHMMDAPVSGGVIGAVNGTLSIMAGGRKDVFDKCMDVFLVLGEQITYCGDSGMGQFTKLANQIIGMGNLAAMCEGLVFVAKAGGDPEVLLRAFSGGAANSWMVENVGPKIINGDFAPGFMADLAQKDLRLVLEAAAEMNVSLFTTPLVSQIFRSVQQAGCGEDGIQTYVKVLERLAEVEVRASKVDFDHDA